MACFLYEKVLLYLPTQIRLLIGGERVTCHWSKLNDALGRKKLNVVQFWTPLLSRNTGERGGQGARFSKAPKSFRARKAIFSSSVSENGEVYALETSCMKTY